MILTAEQQAMLDGAEGKAAQKSMQILCALGKIYGAERMAPVTSVQIAGVSYDNLGEAGLEFLEEMAAGGGKARALATLNPAGMDVENWSAMGIDSGFARNQERVIAAFAQMGIIPTCTCTPYLAGNLPHFGEHIAWAESSAVCYANSVIGARTNREGGPSALAAALTGFTPLYGLHLTQNRRPGLHVRIDCTISGTLEFGALGKVLGAAVELRNSKPVPYITGVSSASLEELKAFCASAATYGGLALFHMAGVTPEAQSYSPPAEIVSISQTEIDLAAAEMTDETEDEVDFVSLGCPHLSIWEVARVAELLEGQQVRKTFWITTSRPVKKMADLAGYTKIIEDSGAVFAVDTCCVVAPIRSRFRLIATDSAKACYYARAKNKFQTRCLPFDEVIAEALK